MPPKNQATPETEAQPTADAPAAEQPQAAPSQISLTEFCIRLSETNRRVELIGAFESTERRAGRTEATHEQFTARYQEFINQPA